MRLLKGLRVGTGYVLCDQCVEMGLSLDALFAPSLVVRFCAEPANTPRTPKLYLWSLSEGVKMYLAASRAVHFFVILARNSASLL